MFVARLAQFNNWNRQPWRRYLLTLMSAAGVVGGHREELCPELVAPNLKDWTFYFFSWVLNLLSYPNYPYVNGFFPMVPWLPLVTFQAEWNLMILMPLVIFQDVLNPRLALVTWNPMWKSTPSMCNLLALRSQWLQNSTHWRQPGNTCYLEVITIFFVQTPSPLNFRKLHWWQQPFYQLHPQGMMSSGGSTIFAWPMRNAITWKTGDTRWFAKQAQTCGRRGLASGKPFK